MSPATRGPDAGTLLRRAIERDAADGGCTLEATVLLTTRWASATFVGARHRLTLRGYADSAFEAWLARLPEVDLPIRRHLVADVTMLSVLRRDGVATVEVEALTVEE